MDRYQVYWNEIGGNIDNCSWFLNRADSNKHVQQSQNVTKVCILDESKYIPCDVSAISIWISLVRNTQYDS